MALTSIEKVRVEVGDVDPALPVLPDSTYEYLLEKNSNSIPRASVDAARIILMNLSQRTDETIDIFSVKGSKAADSYRQALLLYISNPATNPILSAANLQVFFGGTSKSANESNVSNSDNVTVQTPSDIIPVKIGYWDFIGY